MIFLTKLQMQVKQTTSQISAEFVRSICLKKVITAFFIFSKSFEFSFHPEVLQINFLEHNVLGFFFKKNPFS